MVVCNSFQIQKKRKRKTRLTKMANATETGAGSLGTDESIPKVSTRFTLAIQ